MDNRAIGVFDSGVGGVTVLKEIKTVLPNENYIYIGDTASFPYGSKSKQTIIELSKKHIQKLISLDVKMVVIACGTATSQALNEMKNFFNIPILGIINPTIEYLKKENLKRIGVIATTGTIRSKGWKNSLEREINDVIVLSKACPLLAPMAEEGWTENEIAKLTIKEYLKDIRDIDALILGCTHYPLFEKLIKKELGNNIEIINTGKMVANEIKKYIEQNNLQNSMERSLTEIYLTDTECNFINVAKNILKVENLNIKKIE